MINIKFEYREELREYDDIGGTAIYTIIKNNHAYHEDAFKIRVTLKQAKQFMGFLDKFCELMQEDSREMTLKKLESILYS